MLLPLALFLAFTCWTLFHWQELPELLKNESSGDKWPLSIHHTATPIRLITVTILHAVFSSCLFYVVDTALTYFYHTEWLHWITFVLLVTTHFTPITSRVSSHVRYYFQRHLFFPALPSHQEDTIIATLMSQADANASTVSEIERLHTLLKKQFRGYLHAINLRSLKDERALVRREFKQMRFQGVMDEAQLSSLELQQLRFHLYSCYRLLTRLILSKFWSGRERRRAFRDIGYTINTGDGSLYAQCRRIKYAITHYLLNRNRHKT